MIRQNSSTKAKPTVVDVVPFDSNDPEEMLRIAACMESISSMAKAVSAAEHLATGDAFKVEYVVAHGILLRSRPWAVIASIAAL